MSRSTALLVRSLPRPLMLAAFAAALVACGGGSDDEPAADPNVPTVTFASGDDFRFRPPTASATAGELRIVHEKDGSQTHTFVIEGVLRLVDDDDKTVELEAGDYTFYCDVPGHRSAGMEGTLTITP